MPELQNPFDSVAPYPHAADTAAASVAEHLEAAAETYGVGPAVLNDLPVIRAHNEQQHRALVYRDQHRFVLDEAAFMEAIEPPPLFLQVPDAVTKILAWR